MTLLNKLTIKNLKLNKKRTIVTIVGIILSVALITAVASIYTSGIASLIDYEINVKGNFHVSFSDVEIDEIDTIKNNREVEDVYITQEVGYSLLEDSKNEYKPYAYVMAFTEESLENLAINLTEGRFPENDTEIVIPTHLKSNGRIELNIGDTITLDVGTRLRDGEKVNQNYSYDESNNEEIVDTETKTYTIVGIVERPSTNIESYSAPGYTFITYLDKNDLNGETVNVYAKYTETGIKNYLSVTANILEVDEEIFSKCMTNDYTDEEEFEKYYEEISKAKYETNINSYLIELESSPLNNTQTGSFMGVAVVVCIIIVVTSVFCIKNSFDISITEKIKQYGMLKSVGATKKQIRRNVLFEGSILGLIGIPLGILGGFLASYILIIVSNYFLADSLVDGFTLKFVFSWIAVWVAVILGIVTIYLSSIRSSRRAAKISPIDSIRNSGDIKIKAKKIKTNKFIHKVFGIGGDISYKNLKRNKKKYRTTVISITVSVSVFIALFSFMNMAFQSVEYELNYRDYDISLTPTYNDTNEEVYKLSLETTKSEYIQDYTILKLTGYYIENPKFSEKYTEVLETSKYAGVGDGYIAIISVGDYQYEKYLKELGLDYEKMKNKGVMINNLEILSYDESDEIVYSKSSQFDYSKDDILSICDENNNEIFDIELGLITDKLPFGLKTMNSIMTLIIVSDETYESVISESNQTIFFYKTDNPDKFQDEIDEIMIDYEDSYYVNNISENVKVMKNLFTLIAIFLYGFIIVITLIGITNIFNTITTNMELRKREFASLKAIGMTKKEFSRMVSLESIFMGTKSLIFGIPIGTLLSYIIYKLMDIEKYQVPVLGIVISIVAVFLLISCIMRYSMNKINKQNIIETIRNENI